MNNDPIIKPEVESMLKSGLAYDRLITIKITCDMTLNLGLGFSSNLSLIVASGIYLGLGACFDLEIIDDEDERSL
jgi:hypothetical protein